MGSPIMGYIDSDYYKDPFLHVAGHTGRIYNCLNASRIKQA